MGHLISFGLEMDRCGHVGGLEWIVIHTLLSALGNPSGAGIGAAFDRLAAPYGIVTEKC